MSKYIFRIKTYSYDSSGYYLGRSDEVVATITAKNTKDAMEKALKLRDGEAMSGTHDKWGAIVLDITETLTQQNHEEGEV